MSIASVSAYLSPTILRNFAISSPEGCGAEGWPIFNVVRSTLDPSLGVPVFSSRGRAAQPVVDGFAQAVFGNRHDGDPSRRAGVECSKIAEKIRSGLIQITARRQIHDSGCAVSRRRRTEREQRFARLDIDGIEPDARARRIMRGK